uniref:Uncharacterized protein n=1 Tax=Romanomermis culicivorax TaxID=13658 RepID=A0A915HKB0_ROMCU
IPAGFLNKCTVTFDLSNNIDPDEIYRLIPNILHLGALKIRFKILAPRELTSGNDHKKPSKPLPKKYLFGAVWAKSLDDRAPAPSDEPCVPFSLPSLRIFRKKKRFFAKI